MTARTVRFARGWAGAVAATLIAAASHVLSGGNAPGAPVLILSLALSGLVCMALAGKVLSLWRLATAVLVSQTVFHGLYSFDPGAHHDVGTAAAAGHAGHGAHTLASVAAGPSDHSSPSMVVGHVLAAVATIAVLRYGEVTAVRLLAALGLRLIPFLRIIQPLAVNPGPNVIPSDWAVRPLRNLGVPLLAMRHRGPPRRPATSQAPGAFITL
ncbi:hypothetical protein [Paenarthrobacter sp. YJN-D]|uniref:hypothetical protein n=1 Tax=Paenarthrobacter sp. YJN-D TaxID=2735317 RepID=UPI0018788071|nr:hypothetical protein [Paenarthrobacter sp. YJN-D]QOT21311.1 hypothetical protein HMI60_07070 [Paenarthrobacter sp. YJN-D]